MTCYRVLDHDADICIEVLGDSLEELFLNAVKAIFSFITDLECVVPSAVRKVAVTGNGELLVNFLNDLLYLWDTEKFLPCDVSVSFVDKGLTAVMYGEVYDGARHVIKQEVKAVTYHKFSIKQESGIFKATIIIDV